MANLAAMEGLNTSPRILAASSSLHRGGPEEEWTKLLSTTTAQCPSPPLEISTMKLKKTVLALTNLEAQFSNCFSYFSFYLFWQENLTNPALENPTMKQKNKCFLLQIWRLNFQIVLVIFFLPYFLAKEFALILHWKTQQWHKKNNAYSYKCGGSNFKVWQLFSFYLISLVSSSFSASCLASSFIWWNSASSKTCKIKANYCV